MSGPLVTGIVALILESRPFATPEQIKSILKETARQDDKTGVIPPTGLPDWGWGKVNAHLAIEQALIQVGIASYSISKDVIIYPNPSKNIINVVVNSNIQEGSITLFDINRNEIKTVLIDDENFVEIDLKTLPNGIYILRVIRDGIPSNHKIVKF